MATTQEMKPHDARGAFKERMASHPFLRGLAREQLKVLADLAMPVEWDPGHLIFREGEPANRFYLILEGEVRVDADVEDRGTIGIQSVGAGEVLGWSWLFPPYFWMLNARASKPTKAIFFYGTPLRERCEEDHDLGFELMKRTTAVVIQRLQATRRQLLEAERPQGL